MSDRVSSRHEGDLGGRFLPFGDVNRVGVTVEVAPECASLPGVQHTAWMLVNLLARFKGVVHRVGVRCPEGVRVCGRVVPLAAGHEELRASLLAGGAAVGVVPIEADTRLEWTIAVGCGDAVTGASMYACGNGWCGGVSDAPLDVDALGTPSPLPFGPYVAACIAAGEVFKAARMRREEYIALASAFYSVWDHGAAEAPLVGGPERLEVVLDAALAGAGAVGCALIHTLWACPDVGGTLVIADNDPKGLESSNLNRYALFGAGAVGQPKATAAAQVARDALVRWEPLDSGIESLQLAKRRVVSAVDRNSSRAAIQLRYPARILSGSTLNLRAEVLRCGPPGVGACLRCFNTPETVAPDEELRMQLQEAPDARLAQLADSSGITLTEAREWVSTGSCGTAGERLLPHLRRSEDERAFAVSFVSVMAGTMLAAELIKDHLPYSGPLYASAPRGVFQFQSPLARSNRASAYGRDPKCPMCDPSTLACQTWADRYKRLMPDRR